jgi:predicted nucleic acid-binding protein
VTVIANRSTKLICDAGPIIHLDEISCIDLLNDFDEIIIPSAVEMEIAMFEFEFRIERSNYEKSEG